MSMRIQMIMLVFRDIFLAEYTQDNFYHHHSLMLN